jgi:two-component system response regulator YesN
MEEPVIDINKRHSLLDYENMREYLKTLRYQIQKMNDLFREFKISYKDNNDMNKAIAYINMNYQRPLTLAMVSNTVSLNYAYFSNVFKKYTGQSFLEYLRSVRVEKAKKLLAETEDKIAEISEKAGYDNIRTLQEHLRKKPVLLRWNTEERFR